MQISHFKTFKNFDVIILLVDFVQHECHVEIQWRMCKFRLGQDLLYDRGKKGKRKGGREEKM